MTAGHPHFPFRFFLRNERISTYTHSQRLDRFSFAYRVVAPAAASRFICQVKRERQRTKQMSLSLSLSHFPFQSNLPIIISSNCLVLRYLHCCSLHCPHHHWPLAGTPNYRCLVYLYPLFSLLHLSLTWGMEHQHPAFLLLLLLLCIVTAQTHYS